jgi:hypothetical protein
MFVSIVMDVILHIRVVACLEVAGQRAVTASVKKPSKSPNGAC